MTWPLFHRIQFYLLQRLPWINLEFNKFLKCITCTGKLQFPLPTPVSLSLCRCYLSSICSYIIQYINWSAGGLKSNIQKSWPIYVTRQTRHKPIYYHIGKRRGRDPDVIWTRSLLIWSQTRYRCATESTLAATAISINKENNNKCCIQCWNFNRSTKVFSRPSVTGLEPAIPRSEVWCLIH